MAVGDPKTIIDPTPSEPFRPIDSQPVTIPREPGVHSTVAGLQTIHYWLSCIHQKASVAAAREGIGIMDRADLEVIKQFAEYGLDSFRQINEALISKALGG